MREHHVCEKYHDRLSSRRARSTTATALCLLGILLSNATAIAAAPEAPWFPKAPNLPKPVGQILRVSSVEELFQAAKDVEPGGTILVADGHYFMPRYWEIKTDNVTLRGASGDRHKVILDGLRSRHGELVGITGCQGITIADLTIQNIKWNGFKINSDRGAQQVSIYNCVIHNIWQRGIKAPAVPQNKQELLSPRDCRIRYCLFYNDRPKQFSDDETDTPKTFNGNYIGGIDVKNTIDWKITDNVFIGIHGRTHEGRGCIYISENGRGCVIERNIFIDCDIAVALGNPSLGYSPLQAIECTARNNFISHCPETGILACFTRKCQILNNTIHDPHSKQGRLIWVQKSNEGLQIAKNFLIGPPIRNTGSSKIMQRENVVHKSLSASSAAVAVGQNFLPSEVVLQSLKLESSFRETTAQAEKSQQDYGVQTAECLKAMRKVHSGFKGTKGYVAQFGDSITYSMAFWSPIGWDAPKRYLTKEDGLPKQPRNLRWRDYVKGTRDKGPKYANYSGWRVGQILKSIDAVLKREKPEVAIVMIGTNDISGGRVPESYRANLEMVIRKCLDAHCVPILNTIPPRRGRDQAVNDANKIIRSVAQKMSVPLSDFYAECLRLRPGKSWDGTIISKDGVHPTGGKSNVYSQENLKNCGYALRNWTNFLVLRQIYFRVLEVDSLKNGKDS